MQMGGLEGVGAAPLQYPYLSAGLFQYQGGFFSLAGHQGAAAVPRLQLRDRIPAGLQGRQMGAHTNSCPDLGKE